MIEVARIYFLIFGIFTIVGGVIGFVKAQSTPSLIAGGFSGAALIFVAYWIGRGSHVFGLLTGIVVSLSLASQFIRKFRSSGKVMPAGIMSVLGVVGVIVGAVTLFVSNR